MASYSRLISRMSANSAYREVAFLISLLATVLGASILVGGDRRDGILSAFVQLTTICSIAFFAWSIIFFLDANAIVAWYRVEKVASPDAYHDFIAFYARPQKRKGWDYASFHALARLYLPVSPRIDDAVAAAHAAHNRRIIPGVLTMFALGTAAFVYAPRIAIQLTGTASFGLALYLLRPRRRT